MKSHFFHGEIPPKITSFLGEILGGGAGAIIPEAEIAEALQRRRLSAASRQGRERTTFRPFEMELSIYGYIIYVYIRK